MNLETGRTLRLFASHNYLSIMCNGKVKGNPEKSNLHTLLMTINADEQDSSLVYIYGIKSRLFLSMNNNEGGLKGVCDKDCGTIFKESYAKSWTDESVISETYITYECVRDHQGTGWFLGLRANGMVRRGSHTTKEFVLEFANKAEEKNRHKILSRRQRELMFLPDVNVAPAEKCEAQCYHCIECGRSC